MVQRNMLSELKTGFGPLAFSTLAGKHACVTGTGGDTKSTLLCLSRLICMLERQHKFVYKFPKQCVRNVPPPATV